MLRNVHKIFQSHIENLWRGAPQAEAHVLMWTVIVEGLTTRKVLYYWGVYSFKIT